MKKHNFYAGPSILTPYTIQKTADAVINFADTGLSVLEVSHRSKEFQAVVDEAVALTKVAQACSSAWCPSTCWRRRPHI